MPRENGRRVLAARIPDPSHHVLWTVAAAHKDHMLKLGPGKLPPVFLFENISLGTMLTAFVPSKYMGVSMWATYATLDESYVQTGSFGFCVDVGNGFTTLIPTVLFAISITNPLMPARILGMMGLIKFYQEFYGTVIYFFQYFFNGRHRRCATALTAGVVVPANFIWMALPALGMWASSRLILDGSYQVFGHAS
eukprot:scaffold122842_cov40-Tisochrysis_lutea.AAC.2